MAHSHDHAHGTGEYFLEQLFTIFVCGAFGIVAILMFQFGRLNLLLAPEFHVPVLVGGIVLLVATAIRGAALWKEAGVATPAHDHGHDHDHVHGPDCDHDHGHAHAEGDDDHGHEHGGIFWRVVVLSFPIMLFLIGLPNEGFSKEWIERRLGKDEDLGAVADVKAKDGAVLFDFGELALAAYDPGQRSLFEGREATLKGQYRLVAPKEFTLFTMKMTCCKADEIPLKARIMTAFEPYGFKDFEWVEVTGRVQFVEVPGKNQYIPVIRVSEEKGIKKIPPQQ